MCIFAHDLDRWLSHIALGLCAVISLNILAVPLTYLDFELRQDYYANVLCQNQDKPIAICGGRCFVDNQVAMLQPITHSTQESVPAAPTLKIDLSVYVVASSLEFNPTQYFVSTLANSEAIITLLAGYLVSIFHPPQR